MRYPVTRREPVRRSLPGLSYDDPFSWLHDDSAAAEWDSAQAELVDRYVSEAPARSRIRALAEHYTVRDLAQVAIPKYAAGRWFAVRPGQDATDALCTAPSLTTDWRYLCEPRAIVHDETAVIRWFSPSPDGRWVAMGISRAGQELNVIHLLDLTNGRVTGPVTDLALTDSWTGGAHWRPDGTEFFFAAGAGDPAWLYRFQLSNGATVPLPRILPIEPHEGYVMPQVSVDGQWLVASVGMVQPRPQLILHLGTDTGWRDFVTAPAGVVTGMPTVDRYVAITDVGASRGRLVAIPFNGDYPNDPSSWIELLPESNAVLRNVRPVGDYLLVTELLDTYARARLLTTDGEVLETVTLPGSGALVEGPHPMVNQTSGRPAPIWTFGFSSLTASPAVYAFDPRGHTVRAVSEPQVHLEAEIVDCTAPAADGTPVPFHLVRSDARPAQRPTLLWAYGNLGVHWAPQYRSPLAAVVAAGGSVAHCHLRGGGEFGREWWEAGRRARKQNTYDDLYAVAEYLSLSGHAPSDRLAVAGGSGGGLLAAVAATQRPDLWRAVIILKPFIDLLGGCFDPYGRAAIAADWGDPDDADDIRRLAALAPLQNVQSWRHYPAVFVDAGRADPRCPAWHARKLAATLQTGTRAGGPFLLRIWPDAGHSLGESRSQAIDQASSWLTFLAHQMGIVSDGDAALNSSHEARGR